MKRSTREGSIPSNPITIAFLTLPAFAGEAHQQSEIPVPACLHAREGLGRGAGAPGQGLFVQSLRGGGSSDLLQELADGVGFVEAAACHDYLVNPY